MLTTKQLRIFGFFGKNTFKEYTFKEIKCISKEKSNSLIQNAIKKFIEEELVIERKIGNSKLYKINHNNNKVYYYLGLHAYDKIPKAVKNSIKYVKEAIDREKIFYSLVIFGSYADKVYTGKSDLDIAVFIENEKTRKIVEIALNSASNKTALKIDYHIITETEMQEMLKADYENLGKQIASKNLPVYNPSIFYNMIKNTRLFMRY
jgi:predicted nucleotidyltransferase